MLVVPLFLFWVSLQFNKTQQQVADNQRQQELLRGYFEQISTLLLNYDLKSASEYSEAKSVAAALTVSTLRDLDFSRRNSLMRFLRSTGLAAPLPGATSEAGVLSGADLSGVDLSNTALNGIDLHSADLTSANLTQTDLGGGANLENVRFINPEHPWNSYEVLEGLSIRDHRDGQ